MTEYCALICATFECIERAGLYFIPNELVTPDIIKLLGETSNFCALTFLRVAVYNENIEGFKEFEKFRGTVISSKPINNLEIKTPGPVVRCLSMYY